MNQISIYIIVYNIISGSTVIIV